MPPPSLPSAKGAGRRAGISEPFLGLTLQQRRGRRRRRDFLRCLAQPPWRAASLGPAGGAPGWRWARGRLGRARTGPPRPASPRPLRPEEPPPPLRERVSGWHAAAPSPEVGERARAGKPGHLLHSLLCVPERGSACGRPAESPAFLPRPRPLPCTRGTAHSCAGKQRRVPKFGEVVGGETCAVQLQKREGSPVSVKRPLLFFSQLHYFCFRLLVVFCFKSFLHRLEGLTDPQHTCFQ